MTQSVNKFIKIGQVVPEFISDKNCDKGFLYKIIMINMWYLRF